MGSFDWITDFAGKLPMDVISEMMGVPEEDRAEVRRQADIVVHREDGLYDVPPAGAEASMWLVVYYEEMVAQRRRQPSDDLTSALIEAELDGDRLTDEDIIAFLFLMVVAGNETTTKLLGHALFHLTRAPRPAREGLRGPGRDLVNPWIEETLRYDTSSQLLARYLLRDVELHGVVAPQGSKLLLVPGLGQPRRAGLQPSDDYDIFRDQAELAQILSLRRRPALLPRRQPGPARDADRAHRAGRAGPVGRGGPRRRPSASTRQRAWLRVAAGDGGGALMSKYAQPDRRPAVVTGASSGIGAATALAPGRRRTPGGAGRPPGRQVRGGRGRDPRAGWRGRRAPARPHRHRVGRGLRRKP